MQPIFDELISFWKSEIPTFSLVSGYFWLDSRIIKGFDKQGNQVPLYKVYINNDLTFEIKKHAKCPDLSSFQFESWDETAERIKPVIHLMMVCLSGFFNISSASCSSTFLTS